MKHRAIIQWIILPLVFITIALGWKYPILGFSVPLVMMMGMIGALSSGRFVCGNLCPRGAFFDRLFMPFKGTRTIPKFLKNMTFRWVLFGGLMGFMGYQIVQNPSSWQHWGRTFWVMCAVTTALGVILALLIHPRGWCSFCPMGTMQRALGGMKKRIRIDKSLCVSCKQCERICPMNIPIVSFKETGIVADPDCLLCRECVRICPRKALM